MVKTLAASFVVGSLILSLSACGSGGGSRDQHVTVQGEFRNVK